jgi:hypothetical protein
VKRYTEQQMTAYEHAWETRDAYGYHQFEDREWGRKFRLFLHGRAWTQRLYASVAKAARRADASLPGDLVALLDGPGGQADLGAGAAAPAADADDGHGHGEGPGAGR